MFKCRKFCIIISVICLLCYLHLYITEAANNILSSNVKQNNNSNKKIIKKEKLNSNNQISIDSLLLNKKLGNLSLMNIVDTLKKNRNPFYKFEKRKDKYKLEDISNFSGVTTTLSARKNFIEYINSKYNIDGIIIKNRIYHVFEGDQNLQICSQIYQIYYQMMIFDSRIRNELQNDIFCDEDRVRLWKNSIIERYSDRFYEIYKISFFTIYNIIQSKSMLKYKSLEIEFEQEFLDYLFHKYGIVSGTTLGGDMLQFFTQKYNFKLYWKKKMRSEVKRLLQVSILKVHKIGNFTICQSVLKPGVKKSIFSMAYFAAMLTNCIIGCEKMLYQIDNKINIYAYNIKYLPLRMCISRSFNERYSLHIIGYNFIPLFFAMTSFFIYKINRDKYDDENKVGGYINTELGYFLYNFTTLCLLNIIQICSINIKLIDHFYFTFNFFPIVFYYLSNYYNSLLKKHKLLSTAGIANSFLTTYFSDNNQYEEYEQNDVSVKLLSDIESCFRDFKIDGEDKNMPMSNNKYFNKVLDVIDDICRKIFAQKQVNSENEINTSKANKQREQ